MLDYPVLYRGKILWLVEGETRCEDRSLVQQPYQVLHSLVRLDGTSILSEFLDDLVLGTHILISDSNGSLSVAEALTETSS